MINNSENMVAGTALETLRTRFKFVARGWAVAGLVGIAPLVGMMILWFSFTSSMTHSLISNRYEPANPPHAWHVTNADGRSSLVQIEREVNGETVITKSLTRDEYDEAIAPFISQNYWFSPHWFFNLLLSLGLALVYPLSKRVHRRFFVIGQENTSNKRIKGALDLVSPRDLDSMVRADGGGDWTLFGIAFPKNGFKFGTGVSGMQRSGKSVGFHDFIKQAVRKKMRLVIHDPQCEFFDANFRPGIDVFFNPSMVGSIPWSIFLELLTEADARELATGAIPEKENQGANAFFDDAARSLLSALILSLAKRGVTDTSELARAFFNSTHDEMCEFVKGSNAAFLVSENAKGMTDSIKASAGIYLNGILAIESGTWTIRDFLKKPEGNIYILGDDVELSPVKRMFVMAIASAIAKAGVKTHEPKYMFLIDEYQLLGDVKVDRMLAALAKYGVAVVVGMQSESQLISVMGEARASATLGLFGNYLQLKINSEEAQKRAQGRFGYQLQEVVSTSQQLSVTEARDSIGISKGQQDRPVVMATEFGMLAPLTGFLKLTGEARAYPAAKINYQNWLDKDSHGVSYVDYLQKVVAERPVADPRFEIIRANSEDYKRNLQIDLLAQSIAKLENRLEGLTQQKAKDRISEQITKKTEQLEKLLAGEEVEITADDELTVDLETGEILKSKEKQSEWGGF
ncbi:Type IV secretion system protein [beta proteobacterium CB]|nr:Type IV secretion system protein [beta proteobacterium CB]